VTHSDRDVTRFRVLGALEVARGQQQLTISAPMQKVLLVVLLLEAGRPIAVDRLIGLMWPQGEPRTARVTVQNYIRRLRRVLDGGDADPRTSLIATDGVGYRLCVERNSVDFLRFCDLLDRARCAARSHDSHQAAQLYGVALAQWQGEPWPGLDGATWLLAERTRLNGMRATAAEEWAAVELELGRPGHVVDLLSDVVRQLPFRESAHALLVRALHASGRTGDALQRFSHVSLASEMGPPGCHDLGTTGVA
jgi:DNA-binding SARP family transcriptional activator